MEATLAWQVAENLVSQAQGQEALEQWDDQGHVGVIGHYTHVCDGVLGSGIAATTAVETVEEEPAGSDASAVPHLALIDGILDEEGLSAGQERQEVSQ